MKPALTLLAILLLLAGYAVLAYQSRGEVLHSQQGRVEQCVRLGGSGGVRFHATIKAENGSYVIAELPDCRADSAVTVLTRRGALYFNTVYAAQ